MAWLLDWISRAQLVQDFLNSKFVKTTILPLGYAMLTGAAGIFGGIPLMWVFMAASLAFAGIITGIVRTSEYRERKYPGNKLRLIQITVHQDLTHMQFPNRPQRRANQMVERTIEKIQLGVLLTNDATFPISVILSDAKTSIEGKDPPRSTFPRPESILYPGNAMVIADDPIDMLKLNCKDLTGKLNMTIHYGHPKKEIIKITYKATVYVRMQPNGFITAIYTNWENADSPTPLALPAV